MTDTTPVYGFPLPSDASRISALPWHLRALSRTLEEKLPGALTTTARNFLPAAVDIYSAPLKSLASLAQSAATTAQAAAQAAATAVRDLTPRVEALEARDGIGAGSPTDADVAAALTQPTSETRRALLKVHEGGVLVTAEGADPTGFRDSTAAFQAAVDRAATAPGGTVIVPPGIFYVERPTSAQNIVNIRKDVCVTGSGRIKVRPGSAPFLALFGPVTGSTALGAASLRDLHMDMSGSASVATYSQMIGGGYPQFVFSGGVGDGLTMAGCTVTDSVSVNGVSFNGPNLRNVTVAFNRFCLTGRSPFWHDHSTIYTNATGQTIIGNELEGSPRGLGATTAIETHGAGQVVQGNRVHNYELGMNITGVAPTTTIAADVSGNAMTSVGLGIQLWSRGTGNGLRSAAVHHNQIQLNREAWVRSTSAEPDGRSVLPRGIFLDPGQSRPIDGLRIEHNDIEYAAPTLYQASEHQAAGIGLWAVDPAQYVTDLTVSHNRIRGALSTGVRLAMTSTRTKITDNVFIDPGSSLAPDMAGMYRSGVLIVGTHYDPTIRRNYTYDTRSTHLITGGVQSSLTSVWRGRTSDNITTCYDQSSVPAYVQTQAPGKTMVSVETWASVPTNPTQWASVGSRITDESTGRYWVQETAPSGYSWRAYSSAGVAL